MSTILAPDPILDRRLAQRQRPPRPPAMYQSWRDLLFLHWRMEPDVVQAKLPPGLTLDTFDDSAWVGIVPFFMRNIRPWWSPPIPRISNFQELNLRTYVLDDNGTPGVWFISLDADTRLGVWWGRRWYRLPYVYARMSHLRDRETGRIDYRSHRPGTELRRASHFSYQPVGEMRTAEPGSLEFFLIERYVLFAAAGRSRIAAGRVHHPPYQFREVDAVANDVLFELNGLPRPDRRADHAIASPGVDVEVFALETASD